MKDDEAEDRLLAAGLRAFLVYTAAQLAHEEPVRLPLHRKAVRRQIACDKEVRHRLRVSEIEQLISFIYVSLCPNRRCPSRSRSSTTRQDRDAAVQLRRFM
ncbi:hypothetical protein GFS60_07084 (plasmid) [Rhodococcus sp. WAY2]|nr:hypothetical protein GFS60_07084 [Rhodococcus sp. WAY2]